MSSYDLPIILVSATDNSTATKIISVNLSKYSILTELIDNIVEDKKYKETGWHVWRLENKYYEASVRLQALPDAAAPTPPMPRADAHLIYLSATEVAS
ncbi:hypothetical protein RR46_02755 [Papilio xuthus]|uniref:Uncharacterized protein n=1 Tax=Papilio xuthus TaxID=66420 RepID=A0A194Q497_PAPXU|nr:hypothetical protein RR46_02755 [Papilio xuthus]